MNGNQERGPVRKPDDGDEVFDQRACLDCRPAVAVSTGVRGRVRWLKSLSEPFFSLPSHFRTRVFVLLTAAVESATPGVIARG